VIRFELDADVGIDPFPFTYVLGSGLNPDRVINTSSFYVQYKDGIGTLVDELSDGLIIESFSAG
jgi:hypothetical protein